MVQEIEAQLAQLDEEGELRVFQHLALELAHDWPAIEKTPGVRGGDACIVRTRIPVWTLEAYRRLGWDDDQLLANFPSLRRGDLFFARLYAAGNRREIDQAIREQDEA